jgi:hypothetical protein
MVWIWKLWICLNHREQNGSLIVEIRYESFHIDGRIIEIVAFIQSHDLEAATEQLVTQMMSNETGTPGHKYRGGRFVVENLHINEV